MNENELLRTVCAQNKRLAELGLVILTEGNVSQRDGCLMAIKPSGVSYEQMLPSQIVLVDIETGEVAPDGGRVQWKPSVDTPIHLEIYRRCPWVGGIAHTHSHHATIFAQNCQPIPCMGTTHADAFNGAIPVTQPLNEAEISANLERSNGIAIIEYLREDMLAVLVRHHGPFTFGKDAREAVDNALILEKISFLARHTAVTLNNAMSRALQKAHYERKHGAHALYGQP